MPRHDPNEDAGVVAEFSRRDKLQRRQMQIDYLRNCREEEVLPPSAPKLIKGKVGDHPFPASARSKPRASTCPTVSSPNFNNQRRRRRLGYNRTLNEHAIAADGDP